MFKYNNKVSFRAVALPSSKHGQDPKTKKEIEKYLNITLKKKMQKDILAKDLKEIIIKNKTILSLIYYFL